MTPDLDAWDPWHPRQIADRLAGLDLRWAVAAGWALDLFLGRQTRPHFDLEIAIPAGQFAPLAARFGDCDFWLPDDGVLHPLTTELLEISHQSWAWERAAGRWRCDLFREPHDGEVWICRRDPRIRRPYREVIAHTADGIPYLAPEAVLLFKAKHLRDKDQADFEVGAAAAGRGSAPLALRRPHPGAPRPPLANCHRGDDLLAPA